VVPLFVAGIIALLRAGHFQLKSFCCLHDLLWQVNDLSKVLGGYWLTASFDLWMD